MSKPNTGKRMQKLMPHHKPTKSAKNAKLCTWTHTFICLSEPVAQFTPESAELNMLNEAGLGKKRVVFRDKSGAHNHVKEVLEGYYPR